MLPDAIGRKTPLATAAWYATVQVWFSNDHFL
jgi:hypothetical protein